MGLNERIRYLLDNKRVSAYEASKQSGVSESTLSRILNENTAKITLRNALKLANYFQVDYEWLRFGEGEMQISEEKQQKNLSLTEQKGIPLIPFDAVAGFVGDDNEGIIFERCEKYFIPEFERIGAEFVIRVSGSSMYPKYSNGDLLACRKINDILFFQWGKVYIIDSSQGQLVKRVFKDENSEYIICVSDNNEKYPPFSIPKSDIRSLYIVLGVVRME
jgi:phage repressor protein C with HTH and peptisase S24 domain